ncbi:MAG TPA: ferric reductase-like transmembrane domain-containing protein [Acetobacteraceae bacterium]|jgi:sulfoxide reductase heme-binding subunit YedZ|nr:ferric reductase-like transmembrane domain-containing protein [Acetobacteraceae bacterium]
MIAPAALSRPRGAWAPWTDKKGRLHPLRAVVFALLLLPGLWLALRYALHMLGPRALNELIHGTGYWAVWLLLTSLMVTPAKAILAMPNIVVVRRMIGNAAWIYACIHLLLFCADQNWRMLTVVSEIASRFYLTIGFVTLLGLTVLGATSTDRWMRQLGQRWKRLHRIVYGLGVLAVAHYVLQTKADISTPLLWAGIFYWLMMWRMLPAGRDRGPVALLGLTLAASLLTAVTEWTWYRFGTHIDPMRVLRSELDPSFGLRPAGQVLALGLLVTAAAQLRHFSQRGAGQHAAFWVALFALGAWADDAASFIFGLERGDDGEGGGWLWGKLGWAALLAVLGFVRWVFRSSPERQLIDALGAICVLYLVMLASNGLRSVGAAFATGVAALWAILAWQTWHVSKLAALTLVPLGLLLAYGVSGLM